MMARPAYSIPTSIEELKKSIGSICADYGIDFCAVEEEEVKKKMKKKIMKNMNRCLVWECLMNPYQIQQVF